MLKRKPLSRQFSSERPSSFRDPAHTPLGPHSHHNRWLRGHAAWVPFLVHAGLHTPPTNLCGCLGVGRGNTPVAMPRYEQRSPPAMRMDGNVSITSGSFR